MVAEPTKLHGHAQHLRARGGGGIMATSSSAAALCSIPPQPPGSRPVAGHAAREPRTPAISPRPRLAPLALLAPLLLLASAGCQPAHLRPSWRVYPLPRQVANDGLAVVNQPDGYGLHIWVDTDTSQEGLCRPRWNPAAARLFNGNGTTPFSSGLATRAEFFAVVARQDVKRALRRELEALCKARAAKATWRWSEPPRSPAQVKSPSFPLVEEPDLLPPPSEVRQREEALLGVPATSP